MGNRMLTGWAAPVAFSPKWGSLEGDDTCPGWIVWGDKVKLTGQWRWMADYGFYVCIAVSMIACTEIPLHLADCMGFHRFSSDYLPHLLGALQFQERLVSDAGQLNL